MVRRSRGRRRRRPSVRRPGRRSPAAVLRRDTAAERFVRLWPSMDRGIGPAAEERPASPAYRSGADRRQRFSGRFLLPSGPGNRPKNQLSLKKKLASEGRQRHNVASSGNHRRCRRFPVFFAPLSQNVAPGASPRPRWGCRLDGASPTGSRTRPAREEPHGAHDTGLGCPLNHTDRSPNDASVPSAPRGPEDTGHGM